MSDGREFCRLLLAGFISQTGSHFLTLALASFVLVATGSPVLSALVFVCSFLPSILVSSRIGAWVDAHISKRLLIGNELVAAASTVACATAIAFEWHVTVLCLILSVRSLFLFTGRSAVTKWVKLISPPESQGSRIKVLHLTFFLSTALSGALAAFALSRVTIHAVAVLDVATYLIGALVVTSLSSLVHPLHQQSESTQMPAKQLSLISTWRDILRIPALKRGFLFVVVSQAILQGAYSVLVAVLPLQKFDLGLAGVGVFQLSASFGIIGGFIINWMRPRSLGFNDSSPGRASSGIFAIAISLLVLSANAGSLRLSILFFFLMNLAYEWIWLHHSAEFFRLSPVRDVARLQFTLSASASFLMAAFTLIYSIAVSVLGVKSGVLIAALGFSAAAFIPWIWFRRDSSLGSLPQEAS